MQRRESRALRRACSWCPASTRFRWRRQRGCVEASTQTSAARTRSRLQNSFGPFGTPRTNVSEPVYVPTVFAFVLSHESRFIFQKHNAFAINKFQYFISQLNLLFKVFQIYRISLHFSDLKFASGISHLNKDFTQENCICQIAYAGSDTVGINGTKVEE